MVKLVYTYASGAYGEIRESSNLSIPTNKNMSSLCHPTERHVG